METVIHIDKLCKKYVLRHERREQYGSFRDTLADFGKRLGKRIINKRDDSFSPKEEFMALDDVSFDVKKGDRVGIIGRNGAGKSTLLKILSRIVEPTSGKIQICGRLSSLLEVGTGFHPELTGKENIYLNGAILGMSNTEIRKNFDAIVSFAEIERFLDTPVKRYSSGMYVRLAFAVAAHLESEILLVDEVLAVGDAQFQKKCLGKMEEVSQEGRTLLFVSHNMAAIRSLCSRGVLLTKGKSQIFENINTCIDRYLDTDGKESPGELDLASVRRPMVGVDETQALRFTRVELDLPAGSSTFKTGQPFTLSVSFCVKEQLRKVIIGFSVQSSDNIRLFDCRNSDSDDSFIDLDKGTYIARATVHAHALNPGLYQLSLGARCETKLLDYLPDVLSFRTETEEQFTSLWLEAPSGPFRVLSSWNIKPA
jgi:lipopolysaccharide transport system ATP-binding protein